MFLFTVEGNIGSGKTTLLSELKHTVFSKQHVIVFEQVKEWSELKDNDGKDILSLFYSDKQKYSYMFQSYVLFSRLHHMLETIKNNPNAIIITERCHLTDLYVFAKSLHELKDLNDIEWNIYNLWHKKLKDILQLQLSGTIYINTEPTVCNDRINKRNRSAENGIPIDYLQLIHEKHNDWLLDRPKRDETKAWFALHKDSIQPVLVIDGNTDMYDYEVRQQQINKIVEFINDVIQN